MNATEQRTHRTVTQALEARLDDVEAFALRLMKNDEVLAQSCDSLESRLPLLADRMKALAEEFDACNRECDRLRKWRVVLEGTTVWRRLYWLLTGVVD